jgi:5-formyltetrahydrofolate cyclo-ligase
MSEGIVEAKAALRHAARVTVAGISVEEKQRLSVEAVALMLRQRLWNDASSVLLFAPMADEVDIWPLADIALQGGKLLALPRYNATAKDFEISQVRNLGLDIRTGYRGIREPSVDCPVFEGKRLDLILVPGVAFDRHGHRIGRGMGFYDRILRRLNGVTCGVAFDQRMVNGIPVERHDVDVDCVLTPTQWIECARKKSALG